MSMPTIPDINANININRDDAINMIIMSIAMEELSIAHILNAEGEKLQYVLGTLKDKDPGEITICDIMAVNNSIQKTLKDVIKAEMLLQLKLEDATELAENAEECQLTIKGQKIWADGNNVAGTRPENVVISLLRNGAAVDTRAVSSKGDGRFTFACLPILDSSGREFIYTIDESVVPAGYTKTIDGFNVINTAVTTIAGTKIWDDDNNVGNKRPAEIVVNLLQNGAQFRTITLPKPADTVDTVPFSFANVPRFDNEGTPYVYTVDEAAVAGYDKDVEGLNITNAVQ